MFAFLLDDQRQPVMPAKYNDIIPLVHAKKVAMYSRKPLTFVFREGARVIGNGSLSLNIVIEETEAGLAVLNDSSLIWSATAEFRGVSNPVGFLIAWIRKILRLCPVRSIKIEAWKYAIDWDWVDYPEDLDRERMSEIRHFLLERYSGQCQYCGNPAYDIEHIVPRCKGGTNALSNLTLACRDCNSAKGHQDIEDFLVDSPILLDKILSNARKHSPKNDRFTNNVAREVYRALPEKLPVVSIVASSVPQKVYLLRKIANVQDISAVPLWLQSAYLNATKKITIGDIKPVVITRHDFLND